MAKQRKKPTFQLVIQIGNFPRISRYYASAVEFFSREQAIEAGKKWLRDNGLEVEQKYIHTRHVHRGPKEEAKSLNSKQVNAFAKGLAYWVHDKKTRQQLGVLDAY